MSEGITYCPAFAEDTGFGAIIDFFKFRWIRSCIPNQEYEAEDMQKTALHALSSSESSETPFLAVLVLSVLDDTPWKLASTRGHNNMSTLICTPSGHMRFETAHRQSDDMTAAL